MYCVITGAFLTKHSRDLQAIGQVEDAIFMLTETLPGLTRDEALLIINGKKKLIGNDHMQIDMVDENA